MNAKTRDTLATAGLFLLRAATGAMLIYGHGLAKLMGFSERASRFGDPLGVGSPASLALAVFAEVGAAILVAVGLATRVMAVVLAGFFAVIAFIHHGPDTFREKELALVYLVPYLTLALTGPGRWSLDAWLGARLGRGRG